MNPQFTLKEIAVIAGQIIGIITAGTLLWRYFFDPLRKLVKTLKKNSETITNGLPLLSDFLAKWQEISGSDSFVDYLEQVELEVSRLRARQWALLRVKQTPLYECSPTGECVFANQVLCDLFGLSYEDMLGSGWLAGVDATDRQRVYQVWSTAIESHIPYECSYKIVNRRDKTAWLVTTIALPIVDDKAGLMGYLGIFTQLEQVDGEGKAQVSPPKKKPMA